MILTLAALLVGAATVSPATLPANTDSEATVTLDAAGLVRIDSSGVSGVGCTLVDRVRGPFESSGEAGFSHCHFELMLDAGKYLLRVAGSPSAKSGSKVTLTAKIFEEEETKPLLLGPGESAERTLPDGKQASFWVQAKAERALNLHVSGRTAGRVALFRDGVWLEDLPFADQRLAPASMQMVHDWWFSKRVEAGDYKLIVYGTDAVPAKSGKESEQLRVSNDFTGAPLEGRSTLALDWTGSSFFSIPAGATLARIRIAELNTRHLQLQLLDLVAGALDDRAALSCWAQPAGLASQQPCILKSADNLEHLVLVRGEPGQQFELSWARFNEGEPVDGTFNFSSSKGFTVPQDGDYLVGARLLPRPDAPAPLSCVLANEHNGLIGSNGIYLAANHPYASRFNSSGDTLDLYLHIAERMELHVQTDPELHTPCALFTRDGGDRASAEQPDNRKSCAFVRQISEGDYLLRLYPGARGIQTLRLFDGSQTPPFSPPHNSCGMRAHLERGVHYTLRILGGIDSEPFGLELRDAASGALDDIADWKWPEAKIAQPFNRAPAPLAKLLPEQPLYFDFDRAQRRSMEIEVAEAGLYHAATEGLLATNCTLRAPALLSIASDSSGGRGRNCLVSAMLQPGKYLLTVETMGESRGRLAVRLERRRPVQGPEVDAGGEAFFGAGEGELIVERLHVKKAGNFSLGTSARGVELACRLEDAQGWPLLAAPGECTMSSHFEAGDFIWTQLPSTVESVRRTSLIEEKPAVLFSGKKIHKLQLHTWHQARLNRSGHDRWFLELPADLDVSFQLTNGMQGRLYRIDPKDKSLHPVEVIPPERGPEESAAAAPPAEDSSVESGGDNSDNAENAADEEEAERESDNSASCETDECPEPAPRRHHYRPPPPPVARPSEKIGRTFHLEAGPYQLITEHSRGDVKVLYSLFVGSDVLAPGSEVSLPVPSIALLRMPHEGIVRIRTTGDADVRCRLADSAGRLVAESKNVGDDWNCGFAEPLAAGDYTLKIESETGQRGTTHLSVSLLEKSDAGPLTAERTLTVSGVTSMEIPAARPDSVREIHVTAAAPFSCALEYGTGVLLGESRDATSCFLLARADGALRLRLWTLDRPVEVNAELRQRSIRALSGDRIGRDQIGRVELSRPGRYNTGANIFCLREEERGLLRDCSGAASLEAGATLFAGAGADAELKLEEVTHDDEAVSSERNDATSQVQLLAQVSPENSLHLFAAENAPDDPAAPVCSFEGGVRLLTAHGCYAASPIGKRALARWSVADASAHELNLTRLAAQIPEEKKAIVLGPQQLKWSGAVARFSLPKQTARLELTLPRGAWAVLLEGDRPLDLCPPEDALFTCALASSGGELLISSPSDSLAQLNAIAGTAAPQTQPLRQLYEEVRPAPGPLRFSIAADVRPRSIAITGAARCTLIQPDGLRTIACRAALGAGESAQLLVDSKGAPLRIVVAANTSDEAGLGALGPELGSLLSTAQSAPLGPQPFDRSISLDTDALVHVRGDNAVCALLDGATPLAVSASGGPCLLDRFLAAGTHRLYARAFGSTALSGSIFWTQEAALTLSEGLGPESWIAPGESRLFRFTVRAPGNIGIGLQTDADTLECELRDKNWQLVGTGCQQFALLGAGEAFLIVRAPAPSAAQRIRPAIYGLEGAERGVPDEYLHDFFQRIGAVR